MCYKIPYTTIILIRNTSRVIVIRGSRMNIELCKKKEYKQFKVNYNMHMICLNVNVLSKTSIQKCAIDE